MSDLTKQQENFETEMANDLKRLAKKKEQVSTDNRQVERIIEQTAGELQAVVRNNPSVSIDISKSIMFLENLNQVVESEYKKLIGSIEETELEKKKQLRKISEENER